MQQAFANGFCALAIIAASTLGFGDQAYADQTRFTLKAGASGDFVLPINDSPVILTCIATAATNAGTGQMTLTQSTTPNGLYITGNGYDYTGPIKNFSNTTMAHVMYCDQKGLVEIKHFDLTGLTLVNGFDTTVTIMFTF